MRVNITVPRKHNDQVAVLSSDGVGGFVSFTWSSHDLLTCTCHAFCFYSLLVMFLLYPISSILYTHISWFESSGAVMTILLFWCMSNFGTHRSYPATISIFQYLSSYHQHILLNYFDEHMLYLFSKSRFLQSLTVSRKYNNHNLHCSSSFGCSILPPLAFLAHHPET